MSNVQAHPQQTIKLAIDCETGEIIASEQLLEMSEAEFSALRRAAMKARVDRKQGLDSVRFQCAICKQPLYLSRFIRDYTNRWFAHDGKSEHCPWYEGNRLSPDQTKALIYRGQQEGAKHQSIKQFLANWLRKDKSVTNICLEQTTFSEVVKGEWRRPDVKCTYNGKPIVFEIQLSYTFLSDVIARDEFYRREGISIIWVFTLFDPTRAVITDEAFFNRRNLFVLDDCAMSESILRESLTFSGYRQTPQLIDEKVCDVWSAEFIQMQDVIFPSETYRPYFFDYDSALRSVENNLAKAAQEKKQALLSRNIQSYIEAALHYYEQDYANDAKVVLLAAADVLSKNELCSHDAASLKDEEFYGWHSVLAVLLSIKLDRPIGYNSNLSVFQVIEAGLRTGYRNVGKHAFAILYLSAYTSFSPTVTSKNRHWLQDYSRKVKESIEAGEDTYRRFAGYDATISLLFPELKKYVVSKYGLPSETNENS